MKKLGMTLLVASLLVTTVFSLGSCNKADTNGNANTEESVPTVYDYIVYEELDPSLRDDNNDGTWIDCYYCTQNIPNHYPDNRLYKCNHELEFIDYAFYCPEHSHVHYFEATDDCTPPGQTQPYFCEYKGQRQHRHIVTYTSRYFFNGWHVGGGGASE